ncbi:type III-B CRISPR-associated protein Cas10/Cmr2 [Candidatus Acidulodesulfobacterium sp. H_13]|uniref:type III-B CRISPR-associated protein Cas10/Cmr2 n=1 Tax=Candidatus Acidulodesulfobacterium sp. H_13 TaxID=3395470 RepID=UPI003AF430E1
MNKLLFIFTISPVQSFIAQARKTADLYGGSKLLSELVKKVINELFENEAVGNELIFPSKDAPDKPNKFIGVITNKPKEIENKIEKLIKDKLNFYFSEALKNYRNTSDGISDEKKQKCINQLESLFKISWAALPYDHNDPINYPKQFKKIESLLGAVKSVRVFEQYPETDAKCSLCGERDIVFGRGNGALKKQTAEFKVPDSRKRIEENEFLCAVCFTKRFYNESNKSFPSTAKIALEYTLQKLDGCKINAYKNLFNSNFDEQLFYYENLTEKYFKKHGLNNLSDIRKENLNIRELARNENLKFNKYYALIMLDIDDMGKCLSGKWLKNDAGLLDFHKYLAGCLNKFATEVQKIFENESIGKLIYAGGDDVMAFVNINELFCVIKELRKEFEKEFEKTITEKKITFSAGIVIAHYKSPLSDVISWARKMEKEAKDVASKNTFGLGLMTHSGNLFKTVGKWQNFDLIEKLVSLSEDFSDKYVFAFKQEMTPLFDGSKWSYDELNDAEDMALTELERLIVRAKQNLKKEDAIKKLEEYNLHKELSHFFYFNLHEPHVNKYYFDIDNFSSLLEAARFFSKNICKKKLLEIYKNKKTGSEADDSTETETS